MNTTAEQVKELTSGQACARPRTRSELVLTIAPPIAIALASRVYTGPRWCAARIAASMRSLLLGFPLICTMLSL
jgi:hypothetical protein